MLLFVIGICLGLFMNELKGVRGVWMGERIEATQGMMDMRRMTKWEERREEGPGVWSSLFLLALRSKGVLFVFTIYDVPI